MLILTTVTVLVTIVTNMYIVVKFLLSIFNDGNCLISTPYDFVLKVIQTETLSFDLLTTVH